MNLRKDHYRIVKGERRGCVCARHFPPPSPFVRGDGSIRRGRPNSLRGAPRAHCYAQRTPTVALDGLVRRRPWVLNGVTKLLCGSAFEPAAQEHCRTKRRESKNCSTRLAALCCQVREERRRTRARGRSKGNGAGRGCAVREEPRPKCPAPSSRGKPFVSSPNGPVSRFSRGEAPTL